MEIYDEFQQLCSTTNGGRWVHVGLHLHSMESHDFQDKGANAFEYVQHLVDAGIELATITDHNTGVGIDAVKEAARTLKKRGRGSVRILPGVEITASGGIHLLALFDESKDSDFVNHVLSLLKIDTAQRGKENARSSCSPEETIRLVHEQGGVVVGAHCSSDNGVIGGLSGQTRIHVLKSIDALELKPGEANQEKTTNYIRNDLGWTGPILYGSDAHSLSELSTPCSWIKMGEPSFTGFRQIIEEPRLRVSLTKPKESAHPIIFGMTTSGGIYGATPFVFNHALNTIVGGRGTGKSAIVDLLRFALDKLPRSPDIRKEYDDRLCQFLPEGQVVRAFVRNREGRTFGVERRMESSVNRGEVTFLSRPVVYEIVADRALRLEDTPESVFDIEVFGQGEVLYLTRRVDEQLALIDEQADVVDLKAREQRAIERVRANARTLAQCVDTLEELDQKQSQTGELEHRIEYLKSELKEQVFVDHARWDTEREYFAHLIKVSEELVEMEHPEIPTIQDTPEDTLPNKAKLKAARKLVVDATDKAEDAFKKAASGATDAHAKLERVFQEWEIAAKSEQERFEKKLKELNAPNLASLSSELASKKAALTRIKSHIVPQMKKQGKLRKELERERANLLAELSATRTAIAERRASVAETLSTSLRGVVKCKIASKGSNDTYRTLLNQLAEGSRIRNREEEFNRIIDELAPAGLAEMLIAKDVAGLVKNTKVTPNTAEQLVSYLSYEQKLELQICHTDPVPKIQMKRPDETAYTDLRRLSLGEKCSAILSIALLNREKPLLIDQPEDELDPTFIGENVIESIRKIKDGRQLVFATRDANIPVLGDSELVMKVRKEPGILVCRIEAQNSLEVPEVIAHVQMLEGGPEAFERRRRKYSMSR